MPLEVFQNCSRKAVPAAVRLANMAAASSARAIAVASKSDASGSEKPVGKAPPEGVV